MPSLVLVMISGVVYFAGYLFRFVVVLDTGVAVLNWIWFQTILFGTSQFGYILGMVFRKEHCITALRTRLSETDGEHVVGKKCVVYGVPLVLFLLHCVEPSLIIAPITGLGTILCFWLWKKPRWAERFFLFFGKHSTNIWLVHMFFYAVLFDGFVFVAKYPLPIFILMIVVCLSCSAPINILWSKLRKCLSRN